MSHQLPDQVRTPHVAFVGRANIDITVRIPQRPVAGRTTFASSPATTTPGGKSLNQALAARQAGVRASLITNVGDDEWGASLSRALTNAAIDMSFLQVVPSAPTGTAIIEITPDARTTSSSHTPQRLSSPASMCATHFSSYELRSW
ncbi:hypothetical protein DRA43_00980 [Micromonospora provocatoris]|nr:PfkB family carbohydrate kinase [Micromonospora provocatoris]RBJ11220.1 hypothetical protein DRA43_00980 [Micromonospora provocatoris]